ncbi:hypothetical protein Nepgr_005851 [Nepenthes gracilis]|uniref:Uncharacterized protein n=1 Tax=Nepenthes gracilis TaxID=150966 RepID=A0AAD3S3Y1_NEPGR|nr:hypothetical protein Nepgr_005851 [Nepenthes gracilis]
MVAMKLRNAPKLQVRFNICSAFYLKVGILPFQTCNFWILKKLVASDQAFDKACLLLAHWCFEYPKKSCCQTQVSWWFIYISVSNGLFLACKRFSRGQELWRVTEVAICYELFDTPLEAHPLL